MDFLNFAKSRYSVRSFKNTEIEEDKIRKILDAGRSAPTASNRQPQKVYVLKSEESRVKLSSLCRYIFSAPMVLAVCYDRNLVWQNTAMPGCDSGDTDAAIVCTHMMLEAWQLGIGSCWVGNFNSDQVKAALNLPDNLVVSVLMPMGYPADGYVPDPRHYSNRDYKETVEVL